MSKSVLLTVLFSLVMGAASYAASDVVVGNNFGKEKPKNALSENKFNKDLNSFSLRSGMQFRGQKIVDNSESTASYFSINTISHSKGQTVLAPAYNKRTLFNRVTVTFNPNQATYNIR